MLGSRIKMSRLKQKKYFEKIDKQQILTSLLNDSNTWEKQAITHESKTSKHLVYVCQFPEINAIVRASHRCVQLKISTKAFLRTLKIKKESKIVVSILKQIVM